MAEQRVLTFYKMFTDQLELEAAKDWISSRVQAYQREGVFRAESQVLALRDAELRYGPEGFLLAEPLDVPMEKIPADDPRRTVTSRRVKNASKVESVSEVDAGWPFRISRKAAAMELEVGDGRESDYPSRVEWVGQNLNSPLATPSTAPCNASWSMLIWATANQKDFYGIERQVMAKRDAEDEEEAALEVDLNRFRELIGRFSCWKKLELRVRSGEIELDYQ